MKTIPKGFLILCCFILIIIAVLILRPVPIISEDEAITEELIVSKIYTNKENDIFFIMKNTPRKFYINRGIEKGLELNNLKEKLIGKTIIVKYPEYWTPLD